MSKVQLAGNASGTGIFTIASPNSNTDRTLTLPDQTGTLLSSSAQGIPKSALPTGSVLQVVQGTNTSAFTNSSGTAADTGLTATITPTSSSSKILVLVAQEAYIYNGGSDSGAYLNLVRNSTTIVSGNGHSIYVAGQNSSNPEIITNFPIMYLDSPATTSAVTYKTQSAATSGGTVVTSWNSNLSTIVLMEIAA